MQFTGSIDEVKQIMVLHLDDAYRAARGLYLTRNEVWCDFFTGPNIVSLLSTGQSSKSHNCACPASFFCLNLATYELS